MKITFTTLSLSFFLSFFLFLSLRVSLRTFIANMTLPLVVPIIASIFLIPMVLISRCTANKRKTEAVPTFNGRWGIPRVLARWRFLRVPMDKKTFTQWREPVDFLSRLVAIQVFMMYTLYPSLISSVASMLNCSDSILGKRYLMADLSVTCYEGWHTMYIGFAVLGGVVYCIGIPLVVYFVVAWKSPIGCRRQIETPKKVEVGAHRDELEMSAAGMVEAEAEDGDVTRIPSIVVVVDDDGDDDVVSGNAVVNGEEDTPINPQRRQRRSSVVEHTTTCQPRARCRRRTVEEYASRSVRMRYGFLFNGYETDRATDISGAIVSWETVVMARKLFVTLAGATISDAYLQILAAQMILMPSLGLQAYCQPYEPELLDALDTLGIFSLLCTQVLSILYVRAFSLSLSLSLSLSRAHCTDSSRLQGQSVSL